MEYKKEYGDIGFRVIYTYDERMNSKLVFAAHPYELLQGSEFSKEPSSFLVYGRIDNRDYLEVGFRGFAFEMTVGLHERLGLLYEILKKEYSNRILKIT